MIILRKTGNFSKLELGELIFKRKVIFIYHLSSQNSTNTTHKPSCPNQQIAFFFFIFLGGGSEKKGKGGGKGGTHVQNSSSSFLRR